jgi:hypothetical protein
MLKFMISKCQLSEEMMESQLVFIMVVRDKASQNPCIFLLRTSEDEDRRVIFPPGPHFFDTAKMFLRFLLSSCH